MQEVLTLSGQSSRNREVLLCNAALTIVARERERKKKKSMRHAECSKMNDLTA